MIFSDLEQVLFLADVAKTLPEGVREAGAVIRRGGDEPVLAEESVSPALYSVEVIRKELGRVHFRIFLLTILKLGSGGGKGRGGGGGRMRGAIHWCIKRRVCATVPSHLVHI